MTAISYIVQDSQHNKHAIIADQGYVCISEILCRNCLLRITKSSDFIYVRECLVLNAGG